MEKLIVHRSTAAGHAVEKRMSTSRAQVLSAGPRSLRPIWPRQLRQWRKTCWASCSGGRALRPEGPVRLGNSPPPNADLPRSQCVISWTFMAAGTSAFHARPPRCASAPRLAEEDNSTTAFMAGRQPDRGWSLVSRTESTGSAPRATRDRVVVSAYPARSLLTLVRSLPAPPSKTGFVRSKAKAVDPEIARNQNYDDHHANDSEDVHSVLLPFHDDSARRARSASKYKSFLSPPPISPIAASSE